MSRGMSCLQCHQCKTKFKKVSESMDHYKKCAGFKNAKQKAGSQSSEGNVTNMGKIKEKGVQTASVNNYFSSPSARRIRATVPSRDIHYMRRLLAARVVLRDVRKELNITDPTKSVLVCNTPLAPTSDYFGRKSFGRGGIQVEQVSTGFKKRRRSKKSNNSISTRPYACKYCPASFVQCSELISHERSHFGDLPYSCANCDERFASRKLWRKHQASHSYIQLPNTAIGVKNI